MLQTLEVDNTQVYSMAEIRLIAVAREESSSLRVGDNSIIYCWDAFKNNLNELTSINGIQDTLIDRMQGYRLGYNDLTTDTYPPYKPNSGREFHSVKLASLGNGSLRKYSLNGTLISNVNIGTIITKSDFENFNYTFQNSYGSGFEENHVLESSIDFTYSDDGVNYTEDTRKRIKIYFTRKLSYIPINVPLVNFNAINLINLNESGARKYISHSKLLENMGWNTRSTNLDFHGYSQDTEAHDYFTQLFSGDKSPYKVYVENIRGTNCIKYFDTLISVGQKIPIHAFKENKVWVDMTMYNENNPPILDVYYGVIDTGIFRKNNL